MSFSRKAYSVVGALLMLEYFAQFFFIAATIFTIVKADENAKSVYAAFKNAGSFAGLHAINGDLVISVTTLVLIAFALAARLPRRTVLLTALLFLLLLLQFILANFPVAAVSALHGLNALIMVGLGGYLTGRNWAFRSTPASETA
jgi:hypothetical protein